ncbi:MAG: secondary thiamine-phosphate synthase enzyme YjbQ [Bacillota bacterium]
MEEIAIETPQKICLVKITEKIQEILGKYPAGQGLLHIFVPHTTAGITINENTDSDVTHDLEKALGKITPEVNYNHIKGNSPAHLLSTVCGVSMTIPYKNGKLCLGRWQGIYLAEFDGPRRRKLLLTAIDVAY